jgi:hypothetical protein
MSWRNILIALIDPMTRVVSARLFSSTNIPTARIAGYLPVSVDGLDPERFNGAHVSAPDS